MKPTTHLLLAFLLLSLAGTALAKGPRQFSDEVADVDAIGGRVTFKTQGEYFADPSALLKEIGRRDLVDVVVTQEKGGAENVTKLTKTGVAPLESEGLEVGKAVQGVLVATGEVAKAVTTPVPPAHGAVSETVGATTNATGSVLDDAKLPETKQNF